MPNIWQVHLNCLASGHEWHKSSNKLRILQFSIGYRHPQYMALGIGGINPQLHETIVGPVPFSEIEDVEIACSINRVSAISCFEHGHSGKLLWATL